MDIIFGGDRGIMCLLMLGSLAEKSRVNSDRFNGRLSLFEVRYSSGG